MKDFIVYFNLYFISFKFWDKIDVLLKVKQHVKRKIGEMHFIVEHTGMLKWNMSIFGYFFIFPKLKQFSESGTNSWFVLFDRSPHALTRTTVFQVKHLTLFLRLLLLVYLHMCIHYGNWPACTEVKNVSLDFLFLIKKINIITVAIWKTK